MVVTLVGGKVRGQRASTISDRFGISADVLNATSIVDIGFASLRQKMSARGGYFLVVSRRVLNRSQINSYRDHLGRSAACSLCTR